ncbi:MAG TPA: HEAT repeat domain-containing protein, partial [Gemmatimonadales bacterium]|nr:HEAT repeat domain-containing protein [Gemmatimonadales bacterium]
MNSRRRFESFRRGTAVSGLLALLALLGSPARLRAQEQSVVEQLAPVLAAEDARDFQPELFRRALVAPDSLVRRTAAYGAGRIGDPRATPLVVPLLADPDTTVRVAAAFALGLLRDTAAIEPLIDRLTGLPGLDATTAAEAITALAKIGGPRTGEFFAGVLGGKVTLTQDDRTPALLQILAESWRLGANAPVTGLLPYMDDSLPGPRLRAVYSLARLRAPAAGNRMLLILRDQEPYIRSLAARALTRSYADTARLAPSSVGELLVRAADEPNLQVRINALRSLESYHDSTLAAKLVPLLDDPQPSIEVQAAETLGELGGSEAATGLARVAAGKGTAQLRRTALVALANADPKAFEPAAAPWRTSKDWLDRATAARGAAVAGPGASPWFLSDPDGRVIAAGLQEWSDR